MKGDTELLDRLQDLEQQWSRDLTNRDLQKRYLDLLPEQELGLCPFCGMAEVEKNNPFILEHWLNPVSVRSLFSDLGVVSRCSHFLMVQHFFNFTRLREGGYGFGEIGLFQDRKFPTEQPNVVGVLLEAGLGCVAELRTWPMYAVRNGDLYHAYDGISIVYFAPDESRVGLDAIVRAELEPRDSDGRGFLIWPWDGTTKFDHWWDLDSYRRRGLLRYDGVKFPEYFQRGRKRPYLAYLPYDELHQRKPGLFRRWFGRA